MSILDPHPEHPIALPLPESMSRLFDMVECVCSLLKTHGAGPTCWCGIAPGAEVAWDHCSECGNDVCGMGYVRLAAASPYEVFPSPAIDSRCALPMMWAVEVGALRCFPMGADGGPAEPSVLADVAIQQLLDVHALQMAVKCCTGTWGLGAWTPVGPQGGCVGGYWTAFLDVD